MIRAFALLAALSGAAAADPAPIRAADLDRLQRFEESAGAALIAAFRDGAPADLDAVSAALAGRPIVPAPEGDWSCRTIKAGGPAALVAYTAFRCRITRIGPTEWQFEKLSGSQRTIGTIAFHEGRAIYRGVGHTGEAPAADYAGLPADTDIVEPNQTHPQIAVFEQVSEGEARLMFPYPLLESAFDILHLTR